MEEKTSGRVLKQRKDMRKKYSQMLIKGFLPLKAVHTSSWFVRQVENPAPSELFGGRSHTSGGLGSSVPVCCSSKSYVDMHLPGSDPSQGFSGNRGYSSRGRHVVSHSLQVYPIQINRCP